MSLESKQLVNLSKIYNEAVYGKSPEQIEAAKRKKDNLAGAPLTVTNADKKANTKAYQNYKAGNKAYKAADHLKDDKDWGYDKKGNSLNPVDKMKKERKKDELTGAPNVKKESFVSWRQDLKEIPDYEEIPLSQKKRNEKISEKSVKNEVKINPEMKEGVEIISEKEVDESYEATKTKEVMGALKKRDLKKDVKKKIAADIVKKKGDTSKSDDRYAYESKLWDEVAANLTELGELNNARFKVEGYQRDPEKGEAAAKKADKRSAKQKRMDSPDKGINSPAFKEFMKQYGG